MNNLDLCLEVVQGHVNHCGVNSSKITWVNDFKFGTRLCIGKCRAGAQIIFPESGRGLGHVIWHTIENILDETREFGC